MTYKRDKEVSLVVDLNSVLEAERQRLETEQGNLQEQLRQGADRLALVKDRLEHVAGIVGRRAKVGGSGGGLSRIASP